MYTSIYYTCTTMYKDKECSSMNAPLIMAHVLPLFYHILDVCFNVLMDISQSVLSIKVDYVNIV